MFLGLVKHSWKASTRLADEVSHRFSCFVCCVEYKIAPTDAIWLLSFYTRLTTTLWLPTFHFYRSACGIDVASKKLSKMVGISAYIWCIDRLRIANRIMAIACKQLFSFPRYNTSKIKNQCFLYMESVKSSHICVSMADLERFLWFLQKPLQKPEETLQYKFNGHALKLGI